MCLSFTCFLFIKENALSLNGIRNNSNKPSDYAKLSVMSLQYMQKYNIAKPNLLA